ncbi:trafficking kinesin-binding protein 1-like isoform X2 [Corticium candelabrum]|uniref:trafficking kinesin-binding protein 1-like isoform X2 n=1 Tax=Corticium candelabrum TaxID=121492 RepID=UPI002E26530D|nr:trafficking kinesin-binding protein 1-like isoform X2 [Corticium candelabrum]
MDSTSDTTGETQLVSQWTRPTDGVTKNISHLDDDNTMSLENRESLGPAVGAEDCDEGCRLNRENSEEILEEVYESSVTPGDENAESQAPWESSEPRDTRESLFQLLGDVDSLTRIHLAACTDDSETCGMKDEADANLERQADLELAAKIGQALVQKNEALLQELSMSRHRQEELEDNMKQLAHELGQKEDLLKQMSAEWREQEMVLLHPKFWNHVEDSENGSGRLRQQSSSPSICSEDVEALQEECKQLSVSNSELLEEGLDLRVQSLQVEKKESDLITQCVQKLADADDRIAWLIDVADQKAEEARKHDAEAKRLKDHLDELKSRSEDFVKSDHELHQELLSASQKELELQAQVTEWQNKYVECHEMLKVAQDEVRYWRGQNMMSGHMTMTNSGAIQPSGQPSLDDEIQHTIEHELFTESKPATSTPQKQLSDVARVMQTVKAANRNLNIEEISGTTDIDDDELAAPLVSFHDISLDSGVESEQHRATERTEVGVRSTSVSSQSIVAQTAVQPGRSSDTNLSGELASGFASEIRLRTIDRVQVYSAPEKLQIVKPLEVVGFCLFFISIFVFLFFFFLIIFSTIIAVPLLCAVISFLFF